MGKRVVSFNTINLFYPMLELLEKLQGMNFQPANDFQAPPIENGYATAIIVQAVTIFESATTRVWYQRHDGASRRFPAAADYFRQISKKRSLCAQIDETVSVRDAVVHSHPYLTEVDWDARGNLTTLRPLRRYPRFGRKRLRRVQAKGQATKKLKLNLVPTRVSRRDVYIAIQSPMPKENRMKPSPEQYVIDPKGKKISVILSVKQHQQMVADLHDLAVAAERREEGPKSLAEMKRRLKEDGIL